MKVYSPSDRVLIQLFFSLLYWSTTGAIAIKVREAAGEDIIEWLFLAVILVTVVVWVCIIFLIENLQWRKE